MGPVSPRAWVVALMLTVPLGALQASGQEPLPSAVPPPGNGADNAFGTLHMPFRTEFTGPPAPVEARIVLKAGGGLDPAGHVLFAFDAPNPAVRVQFLSLERASGQSVDLETDERAGPGRDSRQPKVIVESEDLAPGEEVVMRGLVEARSNGRFMVGALVIPFDADWRRVGAGTGEVVELYGYSKVTSMGLPAPGLTPPFQGRGSGPLAGLVITALALGCAAMGLYLGRRAPG